MPTRISNLVQFIREHLPPTVRYDTGVNGEQTISMTYLGLFAPADDGRLMVDLLSAVPSLSFYAIATEESVEETLGRSKTSRLNEQREERITPVRSRVTVLLTDIPQALKKVAGRKFNIAILGSECTPDMGIVSRVIRTGGLMIWQDTQGVWWVE